MFAPTIPGKSPTAKQARCFQASNNNEQVTGRAAGAARPPLQAGEAIPLRNFGLSFFRRGAQPATRGPNARVTHPASIGSYGGERGRADWRTEGRPILFALP